MGFGWFTTHRFGDSAGYTTPEGVHYRWYYKPRSRNSAPRSELQLNRKLPLEFCIVPEGIFTRISKFLGFATEFQTNDMEFDKRFYIYSDDAQLCNKLRAVDIRQAVKQVFDGGVKKLEAKDGMVVAEMKKASPAPEPLSADMVADAMNKLADHVSGITPNPMSKCKSMASQANIAMWAFVVALAAGFFGSTVQMNPVAEQMPFIRSAAMYAVPVMIAMLVIVRAQFSGSSRGVIVFLSAVFMGIPATALLSYAAHYHGNMFFDKTPAEEHYSRILRTYSTRHKNSTSYHVEIENWALPNDTVSIKTSYAEYQRARVGQQMRIYTHPGYFNVSWVEKYEVM